MRSKLIRGFAGLFLLLLPVAGPVSESSVNRVIVTIALPLDTLLTGTTIVTLEDISRQDAASEELAKFAVDSATLKPDEATIAVPIDLAVVSPNATVNVSVHVDMDSDGVLSSGDWISESIVPVITNSKMTATVNIVKIGI